MLGFHVDSAIIIRVIVAVLFGFGLGLEREVTNKYAGLRTHILVCLGSCIFTILSIYAFPAAVYGSHGDPARIAAQVLTGIGFIGGGTVLRHGSSVYGLTTAATLWVAAAIGMACGSGMLGVGFLATLLSVSVLVFIRTFERNVLVHSVKNIKRYKISIVAIKEDAENIHDFIIDNYEYIHEISKASENNSIVNITAFVDVNEKKQVQSIYKDFQNINGIESISIQEANE